MNATNAPSSNATLGAISVSASIVNLTSCSFIRNRVENNGEETGRGCGGSSGLKIGGGAFYSEEWHSISSRVVMTNCSFSHNQVLAHGNASGMGGAVLLSDVQIVLELCTFEDNLALQGGAMMLHGDHWGMMLELCTFRNNTALQGGAMMLYDNHNGHTARMTSCSFISNHATDTGGAVHHESTMWLTIDYVITAFDSCYFVANSAMSGGAIAYQGTTHTISGLHRGTTQSSLSSSTFTENQVDFSQVDLFA